MDQQYDMSPEMRKMYEIKHKQRMEAKEYYQKLLYNPYRPINDRILFDPSLMRFNALHMYRYKICRTTPKLYFKVMAFCSPFVIFFLLAKNNRNKEEAMLRSGLVKYEDRANRFLL